MIDSYQGKKRKWRLRRREKPIGLSFLGFFIHFPMGIEFGLVILVLLSILMQFKRRIFRIFESLAGDSTSASCLLENECSTGVIQRGGIFFFGILFLFLCIYTAWRNQAVRRFFLEIMIPLLVVTGVSLLIWSQRFGPGTYFFGYTTIVVAICMISIALACSLFEIVPVESGPGLKVEISPPKIGPMPSLSLPAVWGFYFAALVLAWGSNELLVKQTDRGLASKSPMERRAEDAIRDRANVIADLMETGRVDELRSILRGPSAREVFEDRAWGKFVLFHAAEASPQALEMVLGAGLPIRPEFVDHALLRMASYGHCAAYDRLEKYRIEHGFERQDSLGKICKGAK